MANALPIMLLIIWGAVRTMRHEALPISSIPLFFGVLILGAIGNMAARRERNLERRVCFRVLQKIVFGVGVIFLSVWWVTGLLLLLGCSFNGVAMILNGGRMPVDYDAALTLRKFAPQLWDRLAAKIGVPGSKHYWADTTTRARFFIDRIPFLGVMSVGDVLLGIGTCALVASVYI